MALGENKVWNRSWCGTCTRQWYSRLSRFHSRFDLLPTSQQHASVGIGALLDLPRALSRPH
eukprot:scaffold39061_cov33-Attheya_sp.AAC.3